MAIEMPKYLMNLNCYEQELRGKAVAFVMEDARLSLHLAMIEQAMDLAELLHGIETNDEDQKVIQVLGMRIFNAFGASLNLALCGYGQNSALIARDIIETVFLINLLNGDRALIERWRLADKKEWNELFLPVKVREALDKRDGLTSKKRAEIYKLFSELAAHPNMKSVHMMRPVKGGDAVIGPFVEKAMLDAVLSEMGKLAGLVGEILDAFFPAGRAHLDRARLAFMQTKMKWIAEFYSDDLPAMSS